MFYEFIKIIIIIQIMTQKLHLDDIVKHKNYIEAVKVAILHRRVSMVSHNQHYVFQNQSQMRNCICCGQFPRQLLNINFNLSQLGFLGTGYALYFSFQKLCIVLLFVLHFTIYMNKKIHKFLFKKKSKFSLGTIIDQNQLLCLLVFITSLSVIFLFSIYMKRLTIITDQNATSPEDYSILIKNLSQNHNNHERNLQYEITEFFQEHYSTDDIKIKVSQTCMCFNLAPLQRIQKYRVSEINQLKQFEQQKNKKISVIKKILGYQDLPYEGVIAFMGVDYGIHSNRTQLTEIQIQQKIRANLEHFDSLISSGYNNNQLMFVGQMIVSFETQQMCEHVLEVNEQHPAYFYGNKIQMQKAEYPKGIYWHNLHLDADDYKLRNIFSLISCSSIFLSSLFIQVGLIYLKNLTQGTRFEFVLFKFLTTIIINILNIIIPAFVLRFFSDFQGHRTRSQQMLSFAKKCIFLQLMNTLVVPLIILYWLEHQQPFFQKQNGVLFRNVLISVIILMTSPRVILKQIAIYFFKRNYKIKGIVSNYITVRELCELYQYPPFEIQGRYSDMLKTILLTFIFGTEINKIIIYTFVGFFFSYWIDKYNLARKRIVKYNVNSVLNTELMSILHLVIPLFIGTQICLKQKTVLKILLFLISLIFYFKPMIKEISVRKKQEKGKYLTFSDCKNKNIFQTDYRKENPALRNDEVSRIILSMGLGLIKNYKKS